MRRQASISAATGTHDQGMKRQEVKEPGIEPDPTRIVPDPAKKKNAKNPVFQKDVMSTPKYKTVKQARAGKMARQPKALAT